MLEPYAADALGLAAVPQGAKVLDVACGPGTLSFLAADRGLRVDAIDFSPAMIERFEARRLSLGLDSVTARVGDGQALPFADRSYAAAFSMFGLMFFPDRAKGLAELRRVLVPGAPAVISSWARIEDNPVFAAMFAAIRSTVAALAPEAPPPGAVDMALSTEELCRTEVGDVFSSVHVHRIVHAPTYASADAMWASISRTMAPMVLLRRKLGEAGWSAVGAAAAAALRGVYGDAQPRVEMPAWLTVGIAP